MLSRILYQRLLESLIGVKAIRRHCQCKGYVELDMKWTKVRLRAPKISIYQTHALLKNPFLKNFMAKTAGSSCAHIMQRELISSLHDLNIWQPQLKWSCQGPLNYRSRGQPLHFLSFFNDGMRGLICLFVYCWYWSELLNHVDHIHSLRIEVAVEGEKEAGERLRSNRGNFEQYFNI